MTTTTLQAVAANRARATGYDHLPTKDVPVLPYERQCETCQRPIVYDGDWGWAHQDGTTGHYVAPTLRCTWCNCVDPELVTFQMHAWHHAIECDRCGGSTGTSIGD